ncbi:hypothetical protein [Dyadobacter endophyticus]|uniref:hypothetical protein n=1 Tax=Dyadobacter endophyticus TaxID=1749036 RepID=UPI001668AA4F|nr:hypothetical protein [Dyadobacter endophyticus]
MKPYPKGDTTPLFTWAKWTAFYQASIQKLRNENAPEDPKVAREWARFGDASAPDELIKSGAA